MTKLTTIPAGLLLAEDVLSLLKAAAEPTPLWAACSVRTNEMHGPTGAFDTLVLHSEMPAKEKRWELFLAKHWDNADGKKQDGTNFFVAKNAAPTFLEVRTFERLGYIDFVQTVARLLDGLPIALNEDRSWTWDHKVLTTVGRPLYKRAYLLRVDLDSGGKFNAKKWLSKAMNDISPSLDERATRCPFQLAQEAGIEGLSSADYTKTGWILEAYTTDTLERLQKEVFSDCTTTLVAAKKNTQGTLTVDFA